MDVCVPRLHPLAAAEDPVQAFWQCNELQPGLQQCASKSNITKLKEVLTLTG